MIFGQAQGNYLLVYRSTESVRKLFVDLFQLLATFVQTIMHIRIIRRYLFRNNVENAALRLH